MSAQPGIVAPPVLAGVQLGTSPGVTQVRLRQAKTVVETSTGGRREQYAWYGQAALEHLDCLVPTRRISHELTLAYQHLKGELYELVEDLLAAPGPHQAATWKPITLTYAGDGQRSQLWIPWLSAVDLLPAPSGRPASEFQPRVRITRTAAPLGYVPVDQATYDSGQPPAGQAWFLTAGQLARLPTTPAPGELVYLRLWPLLEVLEAAEEDRRYQGQLPGREPRDITLLEV